MSEVTLSVAQLETLAERVVSRLALVPQVKPELLTLKQCGVVLGIATPSPTVRALAKLGVKPVLRGRYSRHDLDNAIGRIRHRNDMAARRAAKQEASA